LGVDGGAAVAAVEQSAFTAKQLLARPDAQATIERLAGAVPAQAFEVELVALAVLRARAAAERRAAVVSA
jgi:hypothetical protein